MALRPKTAVDGFPFPKSVYSVSESEIGRVQLLGAAGASPGLLGGGGVVVL